MPVKATITIRRGKDKLFKGVLTAIPSKYPPHDEDEQRTEALFNIERYINTQGAYRCHIDIENID